MISQTYNSEMTYKEEGTRYYRTIENTQPVYGVQKVDFFLNELFLGPHPIPCGISVSQPGIEPRAQAAKTWNPNL